ncbi:hypothetical protein NL108_008746 [Boleophthalmus pectinirostris]|uniref:uncharacterized protein si:ch211-13c6.2 n=1 Tax=Boleophthalmus pectinirostris TaxID=150288 RepID=UPI00242E4753|nr:uncharacterized protein si:ch211-13c6.2 [Boleophthalmus pectinirostris]KAJ0044171.1 hypothetical protein NL108_008746 [Boleophthalmus pectinirostris]
MDFETPYEESTDIEFINCEICNKSLRGETLYKLHVTSAGHLENEEALIAEGKITRQQIVPVFEDIIQYLEYLKIDEPIIGLDYLVEVPGDNSEFSGIRYNCTLCKVQAYITEAVQHVIGRKHRQKYLEKNRPDLVNWDPQRPQTISGKLIRAKAEIAERQEGTGKPKPSSNKTRRSFPRFSAQGGPHNGQASSYTQDLGATTPKFGSYPERPGRQWADKSDIGQDRYKDSLVDRAPLHDREMYTLSYAQDGDSLDFPRDYTRDYDHESREDFSNVFGLQDQDRRQYSRSQREEVYADDFREPHVQKDVLKEFYTEELRREKQAKTKQWSHNVDSHQHEHMRRSGREIGPAASQSSFSTSSDGKSQCEIYKIMQDYRHSAVALEHPEETLSNPGPSRASPSRSGDLSRKMADIPDPFMRFLKGGSSCEEPVVRKRKSRFSDATEEELKAAQKTFSNEYGPTDPKFPSLRPEIRELKPQKTDSHKGYKTETYQREQLVERSESTGDVFEMLKNIEIENEDEANFLKDRLCSVLREFKARKAEKALQTGQNRAAIVKEYNSMRPVPEEHIEDLYGRPPRENLDVRRVEDFYDDPRPERHDEISEDFQEYQHPVLSEAKYSNSNPHKDMQRWPKNQPHAPGFDEPAHFPRKYQEPSRSRDFQSADHFSDYHSPTSRHPMDHGPRMSRLPQYSRNLDKITSTLLELVARK